MDPSARKQTLVDRRREELIARYPSIWKKIIKEWKTASPEDCGWLMYSANYLFRTQGVRWAFDPLRLKNRLPQAPDMEAARDLGDLDFVLLTHRHKDHLDFDLLRSLRNLPIWWVVPEDILPLVKEQADLPDERIVVPKQQKPFNLLGFRITPFDGLHWQDDPDSPGSRRGVPATGYLVEQGSKRWLFPGDTRSYDPSGLPDLGPVDVLFAHLWLGKGAALQPHLSLLGPFCRFCLALKPRRIILTHLEEWGRDAPDFWDSEHAEQVVLELEKYAPILPVEVALIGEEILLAADL
jgi:L-ascorbate metabolism protein UlaG (beta-lactamase superfamily)